MTTECWEWTGARDRQGYGVSGRSSKAHRLAYEAAFGTIPEGLFVLHHCDNPPCVRPSHLYAGTKKQNATDMVSRGRAYLAKLTPEQVARIKGMDMAYGDGRRLARELGIHPMTLSRIRTGRSWKGVRP